MGVVGLKEDFQQIQSLRREIASDTYLWINAFKQEQDYYTPEEIDGLENIDPHFRINTTYHESLGRSCQCGSTVVSVDGDGNIQRCHFVKQSLGNFYDDDWVDCLRNNPCPNKTCGCHIGYVHLDDLALYPVYGDGVLERISAESGVSF